MSANSSSANSTGRRRGATNPGAGWLGVYSGLVYAFLYLPILVLVIYSFNREGVGGFPPRHLTAAWGVCDVLAAGS